MSKSLVLRISPYFIARIKQNHKLLRSSFSSSASALHEASSESSESPSLDTIHMTDNCVKRMKELQSSDNKMLRLSVETGGCSGFQYVFDLDEKQTQMTGATVDYVEELIRSAFVDISSFPLAKWFIVVFSK
ncbi:Iron-sulfur cluster biosynthesis family protein isoform 2 [Hibiscus syriacus]|uniref:Iron-sulfur cluster biosynthesis family protein isoform 2 n=1 Tax=Hibiscus syriacus TaxID=106335 RepID=A0A6A3BC49_HIBSY|nr:Iron-sulfur cluster biosynthesis family protein isoform 2 [Hibiscus syriacus]